MDHTAPIRPLPGPLLGRVLPLGLSTWVLAAVLAALLSGSTFATKDVVLLNASYDATREYYSELNKLFATDYKAGTGQPIRVQQSHAGSGKQARAVIDGLPADVVSLALSYDIDAIAERHLVDSEWQKRLPNNSCPFTSTIVFLVRAGNPKQIRDWPDLAREGVSVVTPNPKSSGGARWNYLAAYGFGLKRSGGNQAEARAFAGRMVANVAVFDTGARGATVTFLQRGIGDVLIGWESEAMVACEAMAKGKVEIIYPSVSILAEPPVAMIDRNVRRNRTQGAAGAYLNFLYSAAAQELAARHYFRPSDKMVAKKFEKQFPAIPLFTVEELFGGWAAAHRAHFAEGGTFDQLQAEKRR